MDDPDEDAEELFSKAGLDTFSQANLDKCHKSNTRLIGLVLYPPEINYFDIRNFLKFILEKLSKFARKPKEEKLAKCISNFHESISTNYLNIIKNNLAVPYFDDLLMEYNYLIDQSKVQNNGRSFVIAGDYDEIKNNINDSNKVVGLITIEGMHSLVNHDSYQRLETEIGKFNDPNSPEYQLYLNQFKENINTIKKWGNGKHSPFLITFNHHFWNFLGGQALSIPRPIRTFVTKQKLGVNEGMTQLGREVLPMLLDRSNGRRILIDIKHMSVKTREEFYKIWQSHKDANDPFPIICSHSAVNGIDKLSSSKHENDSKKEYKKEYFNTWSINLCDEDIEYIFKSDGLIGMILHEGRLPGGIPQKRIKKFKKKKNEGGMREEYIKVFMANIFHIIRVCDNSFNKGKKAWDLICMGSDLDGLINAFNIYHDVEKMPSLAEDMFNFLEKQEPIPEINLDGAEMKRMMFGFSPKQIVEKVMYKNADLFLQKYFNDAYLSGGAIS